MRRLCNGVLVLGALLALSALAQAQETQAPLFPRVFPDPTGRNGMEEIIRAGDLIAGNEALGEAMKTDATLSGIRKALRDPAVDQALKLLRIGFSKSIALPQVSPADVPYLAMLRNVARLMSLEQYALWADGKTSQAIDSMAGLLRLGYVLQSGPVITNLVGIATDAIGIRVASRQLAQLSEPDCIKLRRLAETWMRMDDPAIASIEAETATMIRKLEPGPDRQALAALLSSRMQAVVAALRQPPWSRSMPTFTSGVSPTETRATALWDAIGSIVHQVQDKWTFEMALVQLMGVHAAIRAHLWEHRKVPDSLDELKLGPLATDPFTGNPFKYRALTLDTYELSSAGPYERDEGGTPLGTRKQLTLEGPWR
jgi:hypothetical protein